MNTEEQKIERNALFLERNSYEKVRIRLDELKKNNLYEFLLFYSMVYEGKLLITIERHKVSLARIIASSTTTEVLPEDRSRLIFLLASCATLELEKANQLFGKEFGPNFKIKDSYLAGKKRYGWQKLAVKAKEIRNGLYNYCYLVSQDLLNNIIEYFKLFQINDLNQLTAVDALALDIITDLKNTTVLTPASEQAKPLMEKIEKFYSATNRLRIDIESLKEETDLGKIKEYVLTTHLICSTKIKLHSLKIPADDTTKAKELLFKHLGRVEFMDLLSVDELERFGKTLELINKKIINKQRNK